MTKISYHAELVSASRYSKAGIREKSHNHYGLEISQSLKNQAHFEMTNFGFTFFQNHIELYMANCN